MEDALKLALALHVKLEISRRAPAPCTASAHAAAVRPPKTGLVTKQPDSPENWRLDWDRAVDKAKSPIAHYLRREIDSDLLTSAYKHYN